MSTVFESLSLKGLRLAHIKQLYSYIKHRDTNYPCCGMYYGNKEQFEKRHIELKHWLESAIEYAEQNDVRFSK